MQDQDTNLCYQLSLRAAIKYAISFLMYYILYFVCIRVVFSRSSIFLPLLNFLNLQKNNNVSVYVIVWLCFISLSLFLFSSSVRAAFYVAAHTQTCRFISLIFFSAIFVPTKY